METLIQAQEREVVIDFQMGCKCRTTISLTNTMQSMAVAFKIQTTSPHKFSVKPPNGFIRPNGNLLIHIMLKPQFELPENLPISKEKFLVQSTVAPLSGTGELPERVPADWFVAPWREVFLDARLRVVYVGDLLLRYCVVKEDLPSVIQILKRQKCSHGFDEAGKTALHIAAGNSNLCILKALIEAGGNVHVLSKKGQTPLLEAAYMGQLEMMKLLLDYGADIEAKNFRGCTAIHLASMLNYLKIVGFLIDRGVNLEATDKDGRTALHYAVTEGHAECVKMLVEAGANKDACSLDGRSALFRAAAKGNVKIVRLMMHMGANAEIKSKSGQSPLEVAMEKGHTAIMDALALGEDLLKAARRGEVKTVIADLKKGAYVNGRDQWGLTGLHCASLKGHAEVVAKLLEHGADVRQVDSEGHTALHCAVEGGHKDVVQMLVSKGADVHAKNGRGITPLQISAALKYKSIFKLLTVSSATNCAEIQGITHLLNSDRSISIDGPLQQKMVTQANNTPRFICEGKCLTEIENTRSRPRFSHSETSHLLIKKRGVSYTSGPLLISRTTKAPIQDIRDARRASSMPRMKRVIPTFVSAAESQPSSPPHMFMKDYSCRQIPELGKKADVAKASGQIKKKTTESHMFFIKDADFIASKKFTRKSAVCTAHVHCQQEARHGSSKQLKELFEQDSF